MNVVLSIQPHVLKIVTASLNRAAIWYAPSLTRRAVDYIKSIRRSKPHHERRADIHVRIELCRRSGSSQSRRRSTYLMSSNRDGQTLIEALDNVRDFIGKRLMSRSSSRPAGGGARRVHAARVTPSRETDP